MKSEFSKTTTAIVILLLLSELFPYCLSESYSNSYQLQNHPEGLKFYRLNVAVSQSLQDYYTQKSHRMDSTTDFAKFVTPYALKPIADSLWQIYTDDEDFANGVLMIVHQIPYEATGPSEYPVETIVNDKGDCDLFSYVAASIMAAGGLNVVLFYYEKEAHMNIGVSLSHAPHDAREPFYFVTSDGIRYYMAECTGGNWQTGWRVGECPSDLKDVNAQVIPLEGREESALGQVSASYSALASSVLSLIVSSSYVVQGTVITFSGQLSPALANRTVTIYARTAGESWTVLGTVPTDGDGCFAYAWSADVAGIGYFRAGWSGSDSYAGADSSVQNMTVLSSFFIVLIALTLVLVCVGIVVFLVSRKTQPEMLVPLPPEVPA